MYDIYNINDIILLIFIYTRLIYLIINTNYKLITTMATFISIYSIKRDQAFQIVNKSYNISEDYMKISQRYATEGKFAKSKRFHAKSVHNLIRAYNISAKYNFGTTSKITNTLTEMGIRIDKI